MREIGKILSEPAGAILTIPIGIPGTRLSALVAKMGIDPFTEMMWMVLIWRQTKQEHGCVLKTITERGIKRTKLI